MPTVRPRTTIYLWEFLLQLLDGDENCAAISWVNRERGEFVLKDQSEIAKLWGKVKGRPCMDKIKLGRAMRYYYKKKLLAKVPRRKAVYRFTKFDYLKQKESEIIRHEDIPEIDFSDNQILDLISDNKSEGESSLPADVDGDEDDRPLETLLAEKHQQLFQETKCQKLLPVEASCNSYENIDNNGSFCNSFYDYNNNVSFPSSYEDYYVPCSEVDWNTQFGRQNYPSYAKNGAFEPVNYNAPQCYQPTTDSNNNYQHCDGDNGGYLASLLVNSILMSDQQVLQDSTNLREYYNTIPVSCASTTGNVTPEATVSPTIAQMKMEATVNNFTATPAQFQDIDTDSALNTLKEFERLLMINRSF